MLRSCLVLETSVTFVPGPGNECYIRAWSWKRVLRSCMVLETSVTFVHGPGNECYIRAVLETSVD